MGISAPVVGTVTASVLDPANNAVVTAHKAFDFSMGPVVAVFNRLPLTSFFAGERSRFEVSAHSLRQRQVGLTKLHRSASGVRSDLTNPAFPYNHGHPRLSLTPGSRIGPYEVGAQIGVGGMGEVYRATDKNLKRQVAIKVLPQAVAADSERLARFQREAEVLASLNHPNIAIIHGLEKSDGVTGLVMELVEGPTLADRIAEGPLSLDDALHVAKQIAEALEAAHERGIIHRDLKPANIKLRPDGAVKVLDFGLAKVTEPTSGMSSSYSLSPTITTPAMTQMGMILGTAAYMSPEQAKGRPADKRTDIWAFACVLFEMLTGQRAFDGEDVTDTLAFVVTREPDWTRLPKDTPVSIRRLIRRALEKDRRRRLSDAADARLEIEDAHVEGAQQPSAQADARVTGRARFAWAVAAGLLLIGAFSVPLTLVHLREPTQTSQTIRFDVLMPQGATDAGAPPAISPDGKILVFVARQGGRRQLWVRPLDSPDARVLEGTDDADYPFWSPDSRSIAFFSGGRLRRLDVSGGPPQTILEEPGGSQTLSTARGGTWNQDGVIVFATAMGPLRRVAAAGGPSTPVTAVDNGEINHRTPSFLPDGRRFVFTVQGGESQSGIYVGSIDTPGHTRLLNTTSSGTFAEPGYLLFLRDGTLMAQRLDIETLGVVGEAFPIAERVGVYNNFSSVFSVSRTGVLAYASGTGGVGSDRQLAWFDRAGKLLERVGSAIPITDVALSPDGQRAAVQWNTANQDIRVVDLVRDSAPSRLTFNPSIEDFPVWSADGNRILYSSTAGGGQNMYWKLASGAGSEEVMLKSAPVKSPTHWSANFILYEEADPKNREDLWALPLTGDRKPMLVLGDSFSEQQGRLSPDEKWIAYVSDETGTNEVYVQSFPPSGGKWQLSSNGGVTPRWRRDGRELFYLALNRVIMSVDLKASASVFDHGSARPLFEAPVDASNSVATNRYDVSADGQRFLVNASIANAGSSAGSSSITLVVNWLANVINKP